MISEWINDRIRTMLKAPRMWGSLEAVELQVLTLLELQAILRGKLEPRYVLDTYNTYLRAVFKGGTAPLFERVQDESRFCEVLRGFVEGFLDA